jgi:hypothetical protein
VELRSKQKQNAEHAFEGEAAAVLQEQRAALAEVLDQLRPPIARPTELSRLLGLNQKLSWSLFKAARSRDDRALATFLPGRRPMERFLEAAATHGVPAATIARARAAFERFERTVDLHGGGSRDAFETMVADLEGSDDDSPAAAVQLRHKRAMFRASSLLFARQARVTFGAIIVHPSDEPGLVDTAAVKGMVGLHRTRRDVPLYTMTHHLRLRQSGDPARHGVLEPIDPREASPEAVGLLHDFCSQPLPQFRIESATDGVTSLEMVSQGVGTSSEVTYFMGHVCRGAEATPGSAVGSATALTKGYDFPVELDISDVLMHESIWDERLPDVQVYKWPALGWQAPLRRSDLLPMVESAAYLGLGPYAGRTPHLESYEPMMSYIMERQGWNPREFRLFRCIVEYPVVHTRLRMVFVREG